MLACRQSETNQALARTQEGAFEVSPHTDVLGAWFQVPGTTVLPMATRDNQRRVEVFRRAMLLNLPMQERLGCSIEAAHPEELADDAGTLPSRRREAAAATSRNMVCRVRSQNKVVCATRRLQLLLKGGLLRDLLRSMAPSCYDERLLSPGPAAAAEQHKIYGILSDK